MAKKPATSSKKTTKAPPKKKQPAASTRKPKQSQKTASAKKSAPVSNTPQASSGLSLDRKLDITGIVLALLGLLILLVLISSSRSPGSQDIITYLARLFGWGAYLLPIAMIAVGLWLVLRNFERIPRISVERVTGILLFYGTLLTFLQFLTAPQTLEQGLQTAQQGQGGGYVGAYLYAFLEMLLGAVGASIAILALFLISLILILDLTIAEMFSWAPPLFEKVQDFWEDVMARSRLSGSGSSLPSRQSQAQAQAQGIPELPAEAFASPEDAPAMMPATQPGWGASHRAWALPDVSEILDAGSQVAHDDDYDRQRARVIEETLASFGAPARVVEISRGPTITLFGVEPDFIESRGGRMRVRVGKISSLADDLALALSARTIRIQAPVPGKGYVGIEVPNDQIALVAVRDVIESEAFRRLKSPLRFALGQDVAGNAMATDLAAMPHLLIAGATGSGKSVCVNSLITCLLLNNTPDDLRLLMVDPKRVELTGYNGIPHLLAPVVVELERVVGALQWVLREMDQRYHKLAQAGCRNVKDYNAKLAERGERKLPYLVVIIDELADLMMLAPDETERSITRLAQLARATGIHLVIATQRPSVDVVTGLIKANFPARIAFAVASGVDSRVILDQPGAERLLGRGDMLFQAPDAAAPVRLQGTFISDNEIQRLVGYWQSFAGMITPAPTATGGIVDASPPGVPLKQMPLWEDFEAEENADPLFEEAVDLARRQGRASISMLQRRLRIGYTRAARLVEMMEAKGIVGPPDPATGTRDILDYGQAAPPVDEQRG
jgi:S-DNA-T family DNA segregation ATPase FtsK/SpoIIIE